MMMDTQGGGPAAATASSTGKTGTTHATTTTTTTTTPLEYGVHAVSSHSASYRPEHIRHNLPHDQSSRWSSGSNNHLQFLTLKLDSLACACRGVLLVRGGVVAVASPMPAYILVS